MKKHFSNTFLLIALLFAGLSASAQQTDIDPSYNEYSLRVTDADTKLPLALVAVSLEGTNIATVSNSAGYFTIKVPKTTSSNKLRFSLLGYGSRLMALNSLPKNITLKEEPLTMEQIIVSKLSPKLIVEEAIKRIPDNYPTEENYMVGFYREIIKKGSSYNGIAEAVLEIYKRSYRASTLPDQARIYKGRRNISGMKGDTLLFKCQGGITSALELDVASSPAVLFSDKLHTNYKFAMGTPVSIDGRQNYVVNFSGYGESNEVLSRGDMYIDSETFAISKINFNLNVENDERATALFIMQSPAGLKATPTSATYTIEYRKSLDKWYYHYGSLEVRIKCNWSKRLFNSNYTINSELVVTDRTKDSVEKFPQRDRLRSSEIIMERVEDFKDDNYWGAYNTIEPDKPIESIIKRLAK